MVTLAMVVALVAARQPGEMLLLVVPRGVAHLQEVALLAGVVVAVVAHLDGEEMAVARPMETMEAGQLMEEMDREQHMAVELLTVEPQPTVGMMEIDLHTADSTLAVVLQVGVVLAALEPRQVDCLLLLQEDTTPRPHLAHMPLPLPLEATERFQHLHLAVRQWTPQRLETGRLHLETGMEPLPRRQHRADGTLQRPHQAATIPDMIRLSTCISIGYFSCSIVGVLKQVTWGYSFI